VRHAPRLKDFLFCNLIIMHTDPITTYALRLKPGDDLRESIEGLVKKKNIQAGWIVTCLGSLTSYTIRFAYQEEGSQGSGHFEIIVLTGTLSVHGCHLHICVSDNEGKMTGGHLLAGCKIFTTAEIVLQASNEYVFTREKDGSTDWKELQVRDSNNNSRK
jgi:hypothetical protein